MERKNATELVRTPGAIIDRTMVTGFTAITRRHRVVAVMVRDPLPDITYQPMPVREMIAALTTLLDQTEADTAAFAITRNGRVVVHLLPRKYFAQIEKSS